MDVALDKEVIFNQVYDEEHVPELLKVPGVLSAVRFKRQPKVEIAINGELQMYEYADEPAYAAIYEIDNPNVLMSEEWANAVEIGRWPKEVRPFTKNRRQVLYGPIQ
ncbi:MAG: hypothetical protein DK304_000612 [Chloroflexi bacterium]|jgi:hypothetical protein|nr:MAG: hypothetical protein DK304_000612 [Chloroflexota bacterium]